ncbi:hypothetical protein OWC53_15520 [Pectobacterium brasiliense]|uniref:RipA family octameric membrane protein n=1 Tax=Pectobacterium brasiliense TaxID=180957 RepID=UPI00227C7F18|nr:hypothetical protein [Pectobacterium brasiliense]WGL26771.1 hypothetical protein OWC53_15520 [Pectobacterium brasiliense]
MRSDIKRFILFLSKSHNIFIQPYFLRKSYGKKWKLQAESEIYSSEIVIVFNTNVCEKSENTKWEINKAEELGKTIVRLSSEDIDSKNIGELQSTYDFRREFEECFSSDEYKQENLIELYKIMVNSSEQLIQRRQITNGFFITIIGSIIGATGFIIKEKIITGFSTLFLIFPILIGLLMCRSWKNLIHNYGKLNSGKFKVIHQLEGKLKLKIFLAEWIALGKGLRKEKYQSFTSTEKNVPNLFSCLLWLIFIMIIISFDWSDFYKESCSVWTAIITYLTDICND